MSYLDISQSSHNINTNNHELQQVSMTQSQQNLLQPPLQQNPSKNQIANVLESISAEARTVQTVQNGVAAKRVYMDSHNVLKFALEKETKYNPYLIPPDWTAAQKHGAARQVGRNLTPSGLRKEEIYEVCPCCDYQIEKQALHMMEHVSQLSFLGSGYPLFFHYMKYCIIILGLIILTSGEFNLLSNFFGGSCITQEELAAANANGDAAQQQRPACVADWISVWSIANKNKKVDYAEMQDILNFTTILVLMILLILFRKEQREIDAQCDVAELTPADYTILLKGLPNSMTKQDIEDFFVSGKAGRCLKVMDVNLVYDVSERVKKEEQIEEVIEQKKKALSKLEYSHEFMQSLACEVRLLNVVISSELGDKWDAAIEHERAQMELLNLQIEEDQQKFSGFAFVSFETEEEKQFILQEVSSTPLVKEIINGILFQANDFKQFKLNSSMVEVGQAPEPLDIIWENLHQPKSKRTLRRVLSFTITMILLITCSILVYLLIKFQTDSIKQFDKTHKEELAKAANLQLRLQEQLPSAIVSFTMVCINSFLIEIIFRKIVHFECHLTHTLYNINLAQKLSLTLFINTAVVTCFINVSYTHNIFGKGGLIYTIFYFFVVNAGSSFVSVLFDGTYYMRKVLVWYYKRQGKSCNLTQQEANKLSELPVHEIEMGYVDIMKTMYITVFYSPVVPFGLVISMFGFIVYYWAQKFAVMRERTVDKQISVQLSIEMTEYLEFIISIYTASNLLFKYETVGSLSYLQVIGFVLGIIYSILPLQLIVEKVFFFGDSNETITYSTAYSSFITTYALSNPITKEKAKEKHRLFIQELLSKQNTQVTLQKLASHNSFSQIAPQQQQQP